MPTADVILIQAPFFADYGPTKMAAGVYFPLGLGYIAGNLRKNAHSVRILDPNVQGQTLQELARVVGQAGARLAGISFMTPQLPTVRSLCRAIRQENPRLRIVLGGAHPSVMPAQTLTEIPEADFAVAGEGEAPTLDLLRAVSTEGSDFSAIPGLVWRRSGIVVSNAPAPPLADLDALPLPARDLLDQRLYRPQSFLGYSSRVGAIHTSRGCPGRCTFCCSGHRLRAPVRERSIEGVLREIDHLVERYRIDYLLIKDDTFTMRKERVRQFCAALRPRHPRLKWHCMGRVNTVDEALLEEMAAAGLHDIFFGLESGNDQILRRAQKGITTKRARLAVEACDRIGISTYGAFIFGLPGETWTTARETMDFACSLPLTLAGFSVLIPYPGTRCFEQYYRSTPDAPIAYQDFIASTGIHYVREYCGLGEGLAVEDLPGLVSEAQRRFYLRPKQIRRLLRNVTLSKLHGYARGFAALAAKEHYLHSLRKQG